MVNANETAASAVIATNERKKINVASLVPNPEKEIGKISTKIVGGTISMRNQNGTARFKALARI